MKFTLSWLKEHLETSAGLTEIAQKLTQIGLVVDEIVDPAQNLKGFKIVEIMEAIPHPQADRLKVCQVNTGQEILQVVCGAPNARVGLKGVLATPGLTIPAAGIVLRPSRIRDVESLGMLCSAQELGLSGSQEEGIIELPSNAPLGEEFAVYRGLNDPLIDIEITPNRGDCLGVRGIARDLAATGLGQLKPLKIEPVPGSFDSSVQIKIEDTQGCPKFVGRFIKGVKNGPSPVWLQQKLQAVGIKSISALVDITNFISFDRGRPLHVFDADTLQGDLVVRKAQAGEKFLALDEIEYPIPADAVVIADDQGVCALAGIMGGKNSGCYEHTVNVFLESALFDPVRIALAGREVGLLSDARYRFERGVDPAIVEEGLEQATQLILELCGGTVSHVVKVGTETFEPKIVAFNPERVQTLGGLTLPLSQVTTILEDLGFQAQSNTTYSIPTWRPDIKGEADLVEEVLRIIGYDHIPLAPLPRISNDFSKRVESRQATFKEDRLNRVRRCLVARRLSEVYTWSFLKKEWAQKFGGGDPSLSIINPISSDMSEMRPSLLPGLLEACNHNLIYSSPESLALFEAGQCYHPIGESLKAAGVRGPKVGARHWQIPSREATIFEVKKDVYDTIESWGFDPTALTVVSEGPAWYHPGRVGSLTLGPKLTLAHFGEIHPQILEDFEIEGRIMAFEIHLDAIPVSKNKGKVYPKMSSYQAVERDFAFIVDQDLPAAKLIQTIQKVDKELIQAVSIFDVYQGKGIGEGKKSLALNVRLVPHQATLTENDIMALSEKIQTAVLSQWGATLRS